MNKNTEKRTEDHFNVLRFINKDPYANQRRIAKKLGLSLGKLNYCLKELKKKGFVKINNFKNNKKKINYVYVLTPSGITEKTKLTINFMKRKMQEYDELQNELKKNRKRK